MRKFFLLLASVFFALIPLLHIPLTASAIGPNLIPNPSVETATTGNTSLPQNWTKGRWGTNTTTFAYDKSTTGLSRTGTRRLRVVMSAYTSGDAKWMHKHVAVTPGTGYTFEDYYKSNVSTRVVAEFISTTNAYSYQELGAVSANATTWTKASFHFTAPANAKSVSVLHIISAVGTLITDDYSLTRRDTTPPSSAITSPAADATVSGTQSITATATDTDGMGGVQFAVDGTNIGPEDTVAPYAASWDTTAASNGIHTITATARNAAGLTATSTRSVTVHNLVATTIPQNGSLEIASTSNPGQPDAWQQSGWGTNTPTFEYVNEGYAGSRSVKVTVSNYVDGDAKWYFDPIALERGKQFRVSFWYKTNTIPHAVAMFTKDNGDVQYFGMPDPQPNGTNDWQYYSETFSMPNDAASVSTFFFVSSNGYVQTDDYQITPYTPIGFNRGLLTLTFDDGHEDNATNALPILNTYGLKTTQCFATKFIEGMPVQVSNNLLAFYASGHEICSHTVNHPFLTQSTPAELAYELEHSKAYLEGVIGSTVPNFASPYGDYNAVVNTEIAKNYRSHRTVDEGYNSKDNFNIYRLRVQNMFSNTTLAEVQGWVEKAKAENTWLILVYHRVANNPGTYDTYITDFNAQMQYVASSGITVKTYNAALDEVTAQL